MSRLVRLLFGLATGGLLACITLLTTVDVIGRYIFNRPVRGAFELTEVMMAALIFAALPLVTLQREHIAVDLLDPWLNPAVRRCQRTAIELACALITAVLAWVLFEQARQAALDGLHTDALRLPLASVLYFGAVAIALSAVIHFGVARWPSARSTPDEQSR